MRLVKLLANECLKLIRMLFVNPFGRVAVLALLFHEAVRDNVDNVAAFESALAVPSMESVAELTVRDAKVAFESALAVP